MNGNLFENAPLSMKPSEKLRKSILELINTEITYTKNLKILQERYLIPLKEENLLTSDEADLLVKNIRDIYMFQKTFLEKLQEIKNNEKKMDAFEDVKQFQNIIYLIGKLFLEFCDKFRLYSTFCSCHSRAVKLLQVNTNEALKAFLIARNPKQQHTASLESYLITPIQRILRYPLLIKTMMKYMLKDSEEYLCMNNALISIEKVANYINEMQRINETFTPLFQDLAKRCPYVEILSTSSNIVKNDLEVRFSTIISLNCLILRDHAWSQNVQLRRKRC
uniref:T-lymphoma invasion and metastasis-inducing protein 1 n=1 Tax=Hydra vulgaris TaxID=6087 RepID=T2MD90_HYDVU